MRGTFVPNSRAYRPLTMSGSAGFTPLAITRTRASFSFGSGRGASSSFNTSGPPYSCATTAVIVGGWAAALEPRTQMVKSNVKTRMRGGYLLAGEIAKHYVG